MKQAKYQYVATTLPGFVQQVAVHYIRWGYYYYTTGVVQHPKTPEAFDKKMLDQYGIYCSKDTRYRQKLRGEARVQYLRYKRLWILMATEGRHPVHLAEAKSFKKCDKYPIYVFGYSISYKAGHPHVRIRDYDFAHEREYLLKCAPAKKEWLEAKFRSLKWQNYGPVVIQIRRLINLVNDERKRRGLEPIDKTCRVFKRRSVKVFAEQEKK